MSSHSSLKTFLYTFLITSLIFGVMKLDNSFKNKNQSIRILSTKKTAKEMTDEMCEKSSSDLTEFYSKNKDFEFKAEEGNSFLNNLFKNLVKNGTKVEINKDEIINYGKDNGIYVISLVLFILLIILWIPYILCVCLKKCCCISESCGNHLKCCVFIAVALSGGVMVCCFIGYSKNGSIVNSIFGLGCSILKIEQHVVNGDDYTKDKLYWIGLRNITNKLDETKTNIEKISDDSSQINEKINDIEQNFQEFEEDLDKEFNRIQNSEYSKLINPNNGEKFVPNYLNLYGPSDSSDKSLNSIKKELNVIKDITMPKMDEIYNVVDIRNDEATKIINNINSITDDLNGTIGEIENSITTKLGEYYDYFDLADSYVRKIMNILFSLNLAIIIAFTVSVLMIIFCNCGTLLVCLFWFIIYIFMLLSFLLGAVLGIISSFVKDASYAVKIVSQNPKEINFYKVELLDVCINGNGSLSTSDLIPSNFDKSTIDDIYYLENKINEGIKTIEDNFSYYSIESVNNTYKLILEHPEQFVNEVNETLDDINTNLVYDYNDEWVINNDNCPDGSNPLEPSSINLRNLLLEGDNNNGAEKNCIVMKEWSQEYINNRYNESTNFEEIKTRKKYIDDFLKSHENLMKEIIRKNGEFKQRYTQVKESEVGFLDYILSIVTPLRKIYIEFISDGSIFDMLNCGFIKRDFNKVLDTLYNEFGSDFKITSNLFLTISAVELLLTISVLIIMKAIKANATDIPNYSAYSQAK